MYKYKYIYICTHTCHNLIYESHRNTRNKTLTWRSNIIRALAARISYRRHTAAQTIRTTAKIQVTTQGNTTSTNKSYK